MLQSDAYAGLVARELSQKAEPYKSIFTTARSEEGIAVLTQFASKDPENEIS